MAPAQVVESRDVSPATRRRAHSRGRTIDADSDRASEGVAVARTLTDAVIVPLHCEGWARYSESPNDIRKAFADAGFADRVRWLEPGRRSEVCNER
jgi:hypothetical protein